MNVNFEAIEKAWFKPKKDIIKVNLNLKGIKNLENYITDLEQSRHVLDELEEYLRNEYEELKQYGADYFASHGIEDRIVGNYETIEDILDKIQELKKELV